jgi:hypothetical protein
MITCVLIDIIVTVKIHNTIAMVATGLTVLGSVFIAHFDLLPSNAQRLFVCVLLPGLLILVGMFMNEACNCAAMMRWNNTVPYHALIECVGGGLFIVLAHVVNCVHGTTATTLQ